MARDPTVSVIIPNYNYGRYLRKRIESVLGQTFQDFEMILPGDCSTDMMIRKSAFDEVGSFDEKLSGQNDIDFCSMVRKVGYRIVWTPWAEFFHDDSPVPKGGEILVKSSS